MGYFGELLGLILVDLKRAPVSVVEDELRTPNELMIHEPTKPHTNKFILQEAGHEQEMTTRHSLEEIPPIRSSLQV